MVRAGPAGTSGAPGVGVGSNGGTALGCGSGRARWIGDVVSGATGVAAACASAAWLSIDEKRPAAATSRASTNAKSRRSLLRRTPRNMLRGPTGKVLAPRHSDEWLIFS